MILITSTLFIVAILSFAQTAFANGTSVEAALPRYDLGKPGIGILGSYQLIEKPNRQFNLYLGIIDWGSQKRPLEAEHYVVTLQVQPGYMYFPKRDNMGFYFGGLIGFHEFLFGDNKFCKFQLGAAPVLGCLIQASDNWYANAKIDIFLRYQFLTGGYSYFGLGFGIIF
jgi:hypothetical protein